MRDSCFSARARPAPASLTGCELAISPLKTKPYLVFVATRVPHPPVTGHFLRTMNIVRGLAEHFSILFFAFHDKRASAAVRASAESAMTQYCESVFIEEVPAEKSGLRGVWDLLISTATLRPFVARKYRSRRMRRAIGDALRTKDIVLAHGDSLPSGQYLKHLSCPTLLTNHNVEYLRLSSYARIQTSHIMRFAYQIQARLTKRYERALLREIQNCVVVSESDRQELARLAPGIRLFVVPNGTDASRPALPAPPAGSKTAIWVGGMNDEYNREAVLYFARDILPIIQTEISDFRWRVVGRDPPPALVKVAALAASGIELVGFADDLEQHYSDSAIAVVPLTSGGGTKLKTLEAMARGRAIVTTPIGAEGLPVSDGVNMEIANSPGEFAAKTIALLRDSARAARIAAAARALIEQSYDWRAINAEMYQAVQSVIADAAPRKRAAP
jgi:glycosyltransferase involved in cell wall biosynthesis